MFLPTSAERSTTPSRAREHTLGGGPVQARVAEQPLTSKKQADTRVSSRVTTTGIDHAAHRDVTPG